MVGLKAGPRSRTKVYAVCRGCFDKGWRPPDYLGF
jgi:hypothetical protein